MKKVFGLLVALSLVMTFTFTSCNKEEDATAKDSSLSESELSLKSLEPDVQVIGTGDKGDYERVIIEEIIRGETCKKQPVSGIVEYYYQGEMVFSVDFGNGECDGVATVTWLDEEGLTQSKVVDVWKLFKNHNDGNYRPKCFSFVFPLTYTMPDGSELIIESKDDWYLLREWCTANPSYDEKPTLNFPVDIVYEDETSITINTAEELREARIDCKEAHSRKCFELILPVNYLMPDNSTITIETEEDWSLIKEWHINNPEFEERANLVFPVDIVYEDGTTLTLNTEEEMRQAKKDCKQGYGAKCFTFNLPISFTMPDASIIIIETEEDWAQLKAWYTENPGVEEKPVLVFPVEITMEDETVLTINNQEEMVEIRRACHPHGNGHGN
ncbi:hypothetical protein HNV12_12865 [Methanococcoides sp. SA1]|uniref:hypothetical protein n=1 Tax=unclassified Lentimicrobium TaxID=2677434 RepID=UPI001556A7A4|nr:MULTISPECIES: hypothetical protein [unclassified Lentimicrobium]NPD47173.1 hypothetical protein [Lentimicrobium sp. S6]NPD84820.1 hypothetical protein [Lentimicrobium sp. L6]NPE28830.1 hypothetical protein [Methanococcoides sp. SA1]